jgi:predicted AlkP superfamily pyrophosphatase or phosphodiesterase
VHRFAAILFLLVSCASADRVALVSFDGLSADELSRHSNLPTFSGGFVRVIPVTPTATSVTHVSMLTGAPPTETGVVANTFLKDSVRVQGFDIDLPVETLVEAARRQGKRVASIFFPTVDGRTRRRSADWGLRFVPSRKWGHVETLPASGPSKMEWLDGTIDVTVPDRPGWFSIARRADGALCGSWSKVLQVSVTVTVYWGPISCTQGYPDEFVRMIDEKLGFWPGLPEGTHPIDEQTFIEQVDRLTRFHTEAALLAARAYRPDLLLVYQSGIDNTEHRYKNVESVTGRVYRAADESVRRLRSTAARVVVTGDHGVAAIEKEVLLPNLVAEWGFETWKVYANGNLAHLYGPERKEELRNRLEATGYFERIEEKWHPHAGDLVVYAWPHVSLSRAERGQHGGLSSHSEFHTALFVFGAKKPDLREMRQTEIAGYVSRLLGITTPRGLAGSASEPRGSPRR